MIFEYCVPWVMVLNPMDATGVSVFTLGPADRTPPPLLHPRCVRTYSGHDLSYWSNSGEQLVQHSAKYGWDPAVVWGLQNYRSGLYLVGIITAPRTTTLLTDTTAEQQKHDVWGVGGWGVGWGANKIKSPTSTP